MTIATAVRALLLTMSPVTALVGQRVYVQVLPQSPSLPEIRVQRVSQIEPSHLRGPINLLMARVQVDVFGTSKASVDAVDSALHGDGVTGGLKNFRGTVNGLRIQLIQPDNVRESYEADELRQYRVMRDYVAHWSVVT